MTYRERDLQMKPIISQSEIEELAYKQQTGNITLSEKLLLDKWYADHDDSLFYHNGEPEKVRHRIWVNIHNTIIKKESFRLWPKMVAAACITLVAGLILYFSLANTSQSEIVFEAGSQDINPASAKAVLILSDGKKIDLSLSGSGNIANQSGTVIRKIKGGILEYQQNTAVQKNPANSFNSIETPSGGEFQLILPDGSRVWLNAKSKLRYPSSFSGAEKRLVELSGEAYFEVKKDISHPFMVVSRGQKITVLGTHFNVNSYPEEPGITTALLEGSILLSNGSASKKLLPGDRSMNDGKNIQISKGDLSQDIAWKNGYFEFSDTDLKTVMKQISRWYGLSVSYAGKMPTKRFTGKIHRNLKLSSALKILSYFEVKFTVSDKDIHIEN